MTMSPSERTFDSSSMTLAVILPAGTMAQTMRGAGSASARSFRVATSETAGLVS